VIRRQIEDVRRALQHTDDGEHDVQREADPSAPAVQREGEEEEEMAG
jgi:hypothetical protein